MPELAEFMGLWGIGMTFCLLACLAWDAFGPNR